MKKLFILILAATAALTAARAQTPDPQPCPFEPTEEELARAYHEDPVTHDITFLFDPSRWYRNFEDIEKMQVAGTFYVWGTLDMAPDPDRKIFHAVMPYVNAKMPGNIGQPEFRFLINDNYITPPNTFPADYIYTFGGVRRCIVVFSWEDMAAVRALITESKVIRTLDEFNLNTEEGQRELANYRAVPGTRALFRSYHPFKATRRAYMAPEPERLKWVGRLAAADEVCADICLSGDETESLTTYSVSGTVYQETIPEFYQEIIDNDRVLYVGQDYRQPGYYEVYYFSNRDFFYQYVQETVRFILRPDIPGPFLIHCQLGTDRTGVICAFLAALCDVEWDEICRDYELSNRMGINEYRDYKMLRNSFERFLGVERLDDVFSVPEAVKAKLVNGGWLSMQEIADLKDKLNYTESESPVIDMADPDAPAEYYNLQGIGIAHPSSPGVYIVRQGQKAQKLLMKN